jgi:hypothetical protein
MDHRRSKFNEYQDTLFAGPVGRKEDRGGERISQHRLLNSQGDELVFVLNGCSVSRAYNAPTYDAG